MCFTVDYNHPKAKIAENDIQCYKVLKTEIDRRGRQIFKAPYRSNFRYDIGYLYCQDKPLRVNRNSFSTKISQGLYSYSTFKKAKEDKDWRKVICRAIIPKGTRYYYNSLDKTYISEALLLVEIYQRKRNGRKTKVN